MPGGHNMLGPKLIMLALQFSDLLEGKTGKLILPINVGAWHGAALSAPLHWILLIIDTVARRVVTMDSYSGSSYKKEVALIRKRAQLVCPNMWPVGPKWRVEMMLTALGAG